MSQVTKGDQGKLFEQLARGTAVIGHADDAVDPGKDLFEPGKGLCTPVRLPGIAADYIGKARAAAEYHDLEITGIDLEKLRQKFLEQAGQPGGRTGRRSVQHQADHFFRQAAVGQKIKQRQVLPGQGCQDLRQTLFS